MPRFLRVGAPGKERPAVLAADNSIRDLSAHIPDFAGEHLAPAVFARLAKLDLLQLPKLDAGLRVGACVAGTTNFIAIGLYCFDHAILPRSPSYSTRRRPASSVPMTMW